MASDPVPLVYNPAAGGGRGEARFQKARVLLAARGITVEAVETQHSGHATDLVRDLADQGHDPIYVMGGDGTVSESVNGLLTAKRSPQVGFIPGGTGNDFLRDFGCVELEHTIDRIARASPRPVDAGRFTYQTDDGDVTRYFNNIFGTGFAPQVADRTNRQFKWAKDHAYTLAVMAEVIAMRSSRTRVILDGEEHEGDYPLVMVCNSIHTGGAMRMAPDARADDGWFDVVTVHDISRIGLLRLFPKIFEGDHVHSDKVTVKRAKTVEIHPERETPLLADGEVMGTTPVKVEMMAGALQVLL